jgi:hypothetical protein
MGLLSVSRRTLLPAAVVGLVAAGIACAAIPDGSRPRSAFP